MPNASSSNGSAGVSVSLHSDPIDPFQQLDLWQAQLAANPGELPAATSLFIGRVRGTTAAGLPLDALELEHRRRRLRSSQRQHISQSWPTPTGVAHGALGPLRAGDTRLHEGAAIARALQDSFDLVLL